MPIEIVEEKAFLALPKSIARWINERESEEKRRSDLRIYAKPDIGTVRLSFRQPKDTDVKIGNRVIKKAGILNEMEQGKLEKGPVFLT